MMNTCKQQSRYGCDLLELTNEAAIAVLDAMALIKNDVLPRVPFQMGSVDDADFEGREHHGESDAFLVLNL
jgi:hypothetical protein